MPISKKIIEQIDALTCDDALKKVMMTILNDEDYGSYQFKSKYEKYVDKYLFAVKKDGDQVD